MIVRSLSYNMYLYRSHSGLVWVIVVNATFNNFSGISSVLLVDETRGPTEKTSDLSQVTDKRYHIMLYTSPWLRVEFTTSVVIGTDCIGSWKSNYHASTATTAACIVNILVSYKIYCIEKVKIMLIVNESIFLC